MVFGRFLYVPLSAGNQEKGVDIMAREVAPGIVFLNEPNPERFARAYERLLESMYGSEYPGLKVRVVPKERNEVDE